MKQKPLTTTSSGGNSENVSAKTEEKWTKTSLHTIRGSTVKTNGANFLQYQDCERRPGYNLPLSQQPFGNA